MHHFWRPLFVVCSVISLQQSTPAQEVRAPSDALALHQLFGEAPLNANARQICVTARRQTDAAGFELLSNWVLPSENHPGVRWIGDFRDSGLVADGEIGPDSPWDHPEQDAVLNQLLQRPAIDSPVLQLIEAAYRTGKLDELRERIQSLDVTGDESRRSKQALLFLVAIARKDAAAARTVFELFVQSLPAAERTGLQRCWSEFLVFWAGMQAPESRKMVGAFYFNLYRDPVETASDSRLSVVRDYIRMLQGAYRHLVLHEADAREVLKQNSQSDWVPYSFSSAASRGAGNPLALWETTDGQAFRIAGHVTDFLSYRIPLRGNFQIECDAYAGSSPALALMIAGTYVQRTEDSHVVWTGSFGSPPREVTVEPPLSQFREVVRLRSTVRDGVLTHYINGRPVLRKELPPNHDPWVSIRTGDRSMGTIRDLRITGEPVVPEQIELIVSPELAGWAAYHSGRLSDWRVLENTSDVLELHSPRRVELAGSSAENLLYYHRPLAEDGSLEYEFFYEEGESCVHPALDRLAFLLKPSGLALHEITDGKYNRTGLTPDNETPILKTATESPPLPLVDNDWNRLKLAIAGDEIELLLNGRSIHKQALEAANRRTFGLFHYRDLTQVRVRNVVWRGEWPIQIPPAFDQPLASRELEFLEDSLPQLKETFEVDFSESESHINRFDVSEGAPGDFEQQPEGIHATTPFGNTYRNSALSPRVRVSGDFDITARFDRLSLNAARGGSSGTFLQASVDNETAQQFRVYRRLEHIHERPRHIVKCIAIEQRGEKPAYTTFEMVIEETTSGTLRLARRGRKVYFLFAQGDSPNYRLLGVHETTPDDVHAVRVGSQSQNQSVTEVLWKRFTIRAESIESEEKLTEQLNAARERLPDTFEFTFGRDAIPPELFELSGRLLLQQESVRMENVGTAGWSASRVRPLFGLQGDFDMEIRTEELEFVKPVVRRGSAFYFQIKYRNEHETRVELICGKDSRGRSMMYVQEQQIARGKNRADRKNLLDRVILEDEGQVESLRLARRGKTIHFLYRLQGASRERLLAYREFTDQPILPGDIYLMLSSGKPGELSSAKLKSFRFRAEALFPNPKQLQPQPDVD